MNAGSGSKKDSIKKEEGKKQIIKTKLRELARNGVFNQTKKMGVLLLFVFLETQ